MKLNEIKVLYCEIATDNFLELLEHIRQEDKTEGARHDKQISMFWQIANKLYYVSFTHSFSFFLTLIASLSFFLFPSRSFFRLSLSLSIIVFFDKVVLE